MKIAVIINAARFTPELEKKIQGNELSAKHHIYYDLFVCEPRDIESTVNKIKTQSYNAFIIGGGDGTVRSAVQALRESDAPVAILPIGTFNLLAKSLNYPNDIDAIFSMIVNGKTKKIDLMHVNDTVVINHAWIGFYYYILRLREKHQATIGKNKLLKLIFNTLTFFKYLPIYKLELKLENGMVCYKTCLIYIGNNEFSESLIDMGARKTLSSGLLAVTILNCHTRWQLFKCMLSMIFTKNSQYVTRFNTDELIISVPHNGINMVLDGELFKMESPLHFINQHKKLTVYTP